MKKVSVWGKRKEEKNWEERILIHDMPINQKGKIIEILKKDGWINIRFQDLNDGLSIKQMFTNSVK